MTPLSPNASDRSPEAGTPAFTVPDKRRDGLDSESRARVDLRFGFCTCGCGNPTRGHFVPGHNQRLRGELTRAHQMSRRVLVRQLLGEPLLVAPADAADLLGREWLAWVARDVKVRRSVARDMLAVAADVVEAEWGDL